MGFMLLGADLLVSIASVARTGAPSNNPTRRRNDPMEKAVRPPLGLVLGSLFWLAALIVLAAALAFLVNVGLYGFSNAIGGLVDLFARAFRGATVADAALRSAGLSFALLLVWAMCMVLLTWMRSASGPPVISTAFSAWLVCSTVLPRLSLWDFDNPMQSLLIALPVAVTDLIIILAFIGYMLDGRRPNQVYQA
jgi:hypothetical protein